MRRRTFLSTSAAAGLGAFALGDRTLEAKAGDIPKRTFGKTDERLTINETASINTYRDGACA